MKIKKEIYKIIKIKKIYLNLFKFNGYRKIRQWKIYG
jgi:hypothetical protein